MHLLDVVVAKVRVGESDDYRPCIVVGLEPGALVTLALCSSQLDLYRPEEDFMIRDDDACFPQTGLRRTSYVIGRLSVEVEDTEVRRAYGRLTGQLARDFSDWIGL